MTTHYSGLEERKEQTRMAMEQAIDGTRALEGELLRMHPDWRQWQQEMWEAERHFREWDATNRKRLAEMEAELGACEREITEKEDILGTLKAEEQEEQEEPELQKTLLDLEDGDNATILSIKGVLEGANQNMRKAEKTIEELTAGPQCAYQGRAQQAKRLLEDAAALRSKLQMEGAREGLILENLQRDGRAVEGQLERVDAAIGALVERREQLEGAAEENRNEMVPMATAAQQDALVAEGRARKCEANANAMLGEAELQLSRLFERIALLYVQKEESQEEQMRALHLLQKMEESEINQKSNYPTQSAKSAKSTKSTKKGPSQESSEKIRRALEEDLEGLRERERELAESLMEQQQTSAGNNPFVESKRELYGRMGAVERSVLAAMGAAPPPALKEALMREAQAVLDHKRACELWERESALQHDILGAPRVVSMDSEAAVALLQETATRSTDESLSETVFHLAREQHMRVQ